MTATTGVAGRGDARAARPGRARTICEGARTAIVDGRCHGPARPRGAVLDLSGPDLRVLLVDEARNTLLAFGPFPEEDVIATWRSIGRSAGLVPMMKACDETEDLARSLGSLRVGATSDRRPRAPAGRKRPRFLARRKAARLPQRPLVHRETEIAVGGAL